MVYLAELLVVMTNWLKIVRTRARNVPRVHGRKRLDDDAFLALSQFVMTTNLASLSRSRKATVSRADAPSCRPVETLKNRLRTTCACLAVASKEESCCGSISSSL